MRLPRSFSAFVHVLSFCTLGLLACPSSKPAAGPSPSASSGWTDVSGSTSGASPVVTVIGSASDSSSASFSFMTAVKAPIVSDDACKVDGDCAAVATCHPTKCVAREHAGTMANGMLCTMDCRGGTLDCSFNHCGCTEVEGKGKRCATLPGPK